MATQKRTILLVDDDELLREMYSVKFIAEGYEVVVAIDGVDAVHKLEQGLAPDAIVFDMIMKNMDGIAFLQTIKKEKLAVHAILVALSNQTEAKEEAMKLAVDAFILKAGSVPSSVINHVGVLIDGVEKSKSEKEAGAKKANKKKHAKKSKKG